MYGLNGRYYSVNCLREVTKTTKRLVLDSRLEFEAYISRTQVWRFNLLSGARCDNEGWALVACKQEAQGHKTKGSHSEHGYELNCYFDDRNCWGWKLEMSVWQISSLYCIRKCADKDKRWIAGNNMPRNIMLPLPGMKMIRHATYQITGQRSVWS
jgi:hypothetical protein